MSLLSSLHTSESGKNIQITFDIQEIKNLFESEINKKLIRQEKSICPALSNEQINARDVIADDLVNSIITSYIVLNKSTVLEDFLSSLQLRLTQFLYWRS